MNIVFNQTISMLECLSIAHNHITRCITSNSSGTKDLDNKANDLTNQAKVLNRIAEYAVLHFVKCNYKKLVTVECELTSLHFGVQQGTVLQKNVGLGELKNSVVASMLKDARRLIQQIAKV